MSSISKLIGASIVLSSIVSGLPQHEPHSTSEPRCDNITVTYDNAKEFAPGGPFLFRHMLYSAGFSITPGENEMIHSRPNVLQYTPAKDAQKTRGSIETDNANPFTVQAAHLACYDDRKNEDDCTMTVYGMRDNVEVAKHKFEHIPSCGHDCVMRRFEMPKEFRELTAIHFEAKDDGMPRRFILDNLEMKWNGNCNIFEDIVDHREIRDVTFGFDDPAFGNPAYQFEGLRFSTGFKYADASQSLFTPMDTGLAHFYPDTSNAAAYIAAPSDTAPRFDAVSAYLGCTNSEYSQCTTWVTGFHEDDTITSQVFSIPACAADRINNKCELQRVDFDQSFSSLKGISLRASDEGYMQDFWMDNLRLRLYPGVQHIADTVTTTATTYTMSTTTLAETITYTPMTTTSTTYMTVTAADAA